MAATITDYFNKASDMSGSYPVVATVSAARSTGGSTLSCDDLTGWATDTPVHFSTFQVASDGTIDTATQTDWKGIVSGNTITNLTRLAGAADSGNASGDRVELNPTIGWLDDLITGLLVSHKQNGGLKDSAVTENAIVTGAVTSSKIAPGAVTANNIDFTTLAWRRITGTSATITIPAAAKYARFTIRGHFASVSSETATHFVLGNCTGNTYTRRNWWQNTASPQYAFEETTTTDKKVAIGRGSAGGTGAYSLAIWGEIYFCAGDTYGSDRVLGRYDAHATGIGHSILATWESSRSSTTTDYAMTLQRGTTPADDVHWVLEYLTGDDVFGS